MRACSAPYRRAHAHTGRFTNEPDKKTAWISAAGICSSLGLSLRITMPLSCTVLCHNGPLLKHTQTIWGWDTDRCVAVCRYCVSRGGQKGRWERIKKRGGWLGAKNGVWGSAAEWQRPPTHAVRWCTDAEVDSQCAEKATVWADTSDLSLWTELKASPGTTDA